MLDVALSVSQALALSTSTRNIMFQRIKRFLKDEDGAVTVDWVVLCAGIVAMAAFIIATMGSSALVLAGSVTTMLSDWAPFTN
jgi:Flp pilus assembly pilin Flp